jgi:HAD superfamily hydrolase (TIGR01509 family)
MKAGAIAGILFDWDGVLLDSLGAAFNVYNRIFSRVGTKQLTKDEFLLVQSPNWYEFYEKVGLPKALWKKVDGEWLRLYQEEAPNLHQDSLACLNALKRVGLKMALVSNGSRSRVEAELVKFELRQYFEVALFGEKKEELKPSPVLLERALVLMGVEPRKAAYVGDSPADIQAAKKARMLAIAIARGPIQKERLGSETPDYIFGGLREATDFLVGPPG